MAFLLHGEDLISPKAGSVKNTNVLLYLKVQKPSCKAKKAVG